MRTDETCNSDTPRRVDLERTRRTFLFCREQVASNISAKHYSAVRAMRHHGPDRTRDVEAPDSPTDSPTQ
jgi:hypothetical protein